jgi:hypothetical protein
MTTANPTTPDRADVLLVMVTEVKGQREHVRRGRGPGYCIPQAII